MLCSVCRRQLSATDARCRACGTPQHGAGHLDLVLATGERVPVDRPLVIGRGPASELRLEDPSVSRTHAEISVDHDGPSISDAGSSFGTFVDGRKLHGPVRLTPGMQIDLGDCRLDVAERVDSTAAGMTISVPAGVTLSVERARVRRSRLRGPGVRRPRLHAGWSLKRLDAAEGDKRYVLKDHRSNTIVRLAEPEAELVQLLDGKRELAELVAEAANRSGPEGPARLARLLAELADRGLLAGVEGVEPQRPAGWVERLLTPRERELPGAPALFASIYRRGGFLLFTRPAAVLGGALAIAGLVAFVALIANRYGTPFVVAQRVGLGAVVFVLGRLLLAFCHELAHGLIAESFGRPVSRAGIKVALLFPYVFVDTTDAWFEPRRRRIAISLAGPASDLLVGGAFAIACWLSARGSLRDVLFQVAFGGYVGALFNLNPLLERDGYHVLVDVLAEPGLRRRAQRRFASALAGVPSPEADAKLLRYGIASACWSLLAAAFAVVMSLRYYHRLATLVPPALVWTLLAAFYLLLALPLALQLLRPLLRRASSGERSAPLQSRTP
jgi:putative peptide zinc metalloprotease protein